jgi:predicted PolB exonuclease-like 3'-5' exonuclease
MKASTFDLETSPQPDFFSLALEAARARAEARGEAPEGIDEEAVRGEMSLSPLWGRIVAVGLLDVDSKEQMIWASEDEREILTAFWGAVEQTELFIGYNSLGFDLPWLTLRSAVLGVQPTVRISQARYRQPGDSNHLDLFAWLTDWRGNRTKHLKLDLSTVARVLGVEPPVGDGSEVPTLFEAGDFETIRQHLASDLKATLGVWRALGSPGRRD